MNERKLAYMIWKMKQDLEKIQSSSGALRDEILEMIDEGHDLNMIIIEFFEG